MNGADKPPLPPLDTLPQEDAPAPQLKGIEAIRDAWKRLPARPGVYRMLGADGEVLYVGKAKSLKNRVGQYAQGRVNHVAMPKATLSTPPSTRPDARSIGSPLASGGMNGMGMTPARKTADRPPTMASTARMVIPLGRLTAHLLDRYRHWTGKTAYKYNRPYSPGT